MDWNNDGNHDCRDDAYYNNVIGDGSGGSGGSCGSDGWKFYVIAFVIYIIFKLMGA